ncbi:MAG: hypothetical protein ABSE63_10510 [Thermoguttaceae bacterium]
MANNSTQRQAGSLAHILAVVERSSRKNDPSDEDTPIAKAARDFFTNNWRQADEGLLAKTNKIRVEPEPSSAPRVFQMHIFCSYKRKEGLLEPVELVPGPIRGTIYYRPDILSPGDDAPAVAVALNDYGFFHPNFSRRQGLLCLGDLPAGPIALENLLEHIYRIVTYQNLRVTDPADAEAATYFATDPEAMAGLEKVEPLY